MAKIANPMALKLRMQVSERSVFTNNVNRQSFENNNAYLDIRFHRKFMNYLQGSTSNSILIFCEAISYGHKVPTLLLAQWLKSIAGNTIIIACPEQISTLFIREGFKTININMINPVKIYQRLRKGKMQKC